MDDEDEIIDLGDETEQVLAQMKKSLKGEQETELAFLTWEMKRNRCLHR